jgi:hypothetical protein
MPRPRLPGPDQEELNMTDADIHAHPPGSRLRSALKSSVGLFKAINPFNASVRSGDPRLLDAGTPLRRYVVDEAVGHDDVVATYHGHSTSTGKEVVIREFLPASFSARAGDLSIVPRADDDGGLFNAGLSHFIREGELVRDLQHPNVVQVLDVFAANRTAYVVTPRERGERLDARRARLGALEDRELVDLAIGVLSGFEQLHEAGIVHGQFNETSVVYSDAGVPIIQFSDGAGLATLRKRIRQAVRNGGAAPRANADEVRPLADLYSLSQMLERLSRRPAGEGRSEDVARSTDTHRPEVLAAIGRALSPDAEQRPDSAAHWKMDFERLRHQLEESETQGVQAARVVEPPVAGENAREDLYEASEARTVPSLIGAGDTEAAAPAAAAASAVVEFAPASGDPTAEAEPIESTTVQPPGKARITELRDDPPAAAADEIPDDPVVADAGEDPAQAIEGTEPVTRLVEAERPPQLTLADTVVLIPPAAARANEPTPPGVASTAPRPQPVERAQLEALHRRRIEELEAHLRERNALLERAAAQLRQYDAAMKQSRLVFLQRDQREKALRARIEDLEAQLAGRAAAAAPDSAHDGDLQALRRRVAELESQVAEQSGALARSAQDNPLQHAPQAQLMEIRQALATEFTRNAALLEAARHEAQATEAARQRLVEQTELVLADYRNRNSRIRAHEEARILEERRLLEVERDYLRSALQTANVAREQAEQMARKAIEQADRLRNLTTAQIAAAEVAVYTDLKLVRSGAAPTTQVLNHEAPPRETGALEAAPPAENGEGEGEAKIA